MKTTTPPEFPKTVRTQKPDGGWVETSYDASGKVYQTLDDQGVVSIWRHRRTAPDLLSSTAEIYPVGHWLFPAGGWTATRYDRKGRNIFQRGSSCGTTFTEYLTHGGKEVTTHLSGETSDRVHYDEQGRVVRTETLTGRVTIRACMGDGTCVTYEYGPGMYLEKTTRADGSTTSYTYPPNGGIVCVFIGPKKGKSTATFDVADRLLLKETPDGVKRRYTYDRYGAVTVTEEWA